MGEEINVTGVSPEEKSEAIISGLAASQEERTDEKETEAIEKISAAENQDAATEGVEGVVDDSSAGVLSYHDEQVSERRDDCIFHNPFYDEKYSYTPAVYQYRHSKKFHADLAEWGMPDKVKDYLYEHLSELVSEYKCCQLWCDEDEMKKDCSNLDANLLKVKHGDLEAARNIVLSLFISDLDDYEVRFLIPQGVALLNSIGDFVFTSGYLWDHDDPTLFQSALLARTGDGSALVSLGREYIRCGFEGLALTTLRVAQAEGIEGATDALLECLEMEYFKDCTERKEMAQEIIAILEFLVSNNKEEYRTKLAFWKEEYNTRSHKREWEGGYIKP